MLPASSGSGETDEDLGAWQWLDREAALGHARELDRLRKFGKPLGALHGVPVGLKDIIDTKGIPTERGSPIFAGRKPRRNAFIVDRLRDAGTVPLGKTVYDRTRIHESGQDRQPA